jgi:Protein of unknown function (DUF3489)
MRREEGALPNRPAPRRKPLSKPGMPKARVVQPGRALKTDLVLAALQRSGGASAPWLQATLGWKPHSVRSLISTLRRRLGWPVATNSIAGVTHYRIEADDAAGDKPGQPGG